MRILIVGCTGLLGKALVDSAANQIEFVGTYIGEYDMQDTEQAKYFRQDIRDLAGNQKIL